MTAFYSRRPSCARRVCKQANTGTFNFTPQIASSICAVAFTKRVKPDAIIFGARCSRTVLCYRFDRVDALPLSRAKVLRLANGSPELVRSPARWSRNVRDATGKKSGEMSRATIAQYPRNRRAAADALSPDGRRDGSQDNLRYADVGRTASAPETCKTTCNLFTQWRRNSRATSRKQLMRLSPSAFNRHIQKL
jgi:hypothetical protein